MYKLAGPPISTPNVQRDRSTWSVPVPNRVQNAVQWVGNVGLYKTKLGQLGQRYGKAKLEPRSASGVEAPQRPERSRIVVPRSTAELPFSFRVFRVFFGFPARSPGRHLTPL